MTVVINLWHEPKVSVPRDALAEAMRRARSKSFRQPLIQELTTQDVGKYPRFLYIGQQDVWEIVTMPFPIQSPARSPICAPSAASKPLPFIRNLTKSRNICI